ncbi:MAG: pyridoxal phosphate-dependent aminotransferase [Mycobacteriales bacterium]
MRDFSTTIFAEMTALALATGAVNLGQGFPDTDGPERMLARAIEGIRAGLNQYPPGPGLLSLREAVSRHRQGRYGLDYDPETEVLVTVGATEAVAASILALCEPGDEVVSFEPYYDSYAAVVALAGARLRAVTLRPDEVSGGFSFDPAQLAGAVGPGTKVILVNSPHNPTGAVFDRGHLEAIAEICRERDLIAVTDEVYEHLVFDGLEHIPLATLPGMRERTVSISSAAKTLSVTGWKIGWLCAPARLVRAVTAVKQFLTFTASGPFQNAVAGALLEETAWVEQLCASLASRRDQLCVGLQQAGFRVYRPSGTFFIQADVRPLGYADASELAYRLPHEVGVVAVPTSVFYADPAAGRPYLRFAFCKREEVLAEAISRLARLAKRPAAEPV